jgi:hypothetical protein
MCLTLNAQGSVVTDKDGMEEEEEEKRKRKGTHSGRRTGGQFCRPCAKTAIVLSGSLTNERLSVMWIDQKSKFKIQ